MNDFSVVDMHAGTVPGQPGKGDKELEHVSKLAILWYKRIVDGTISHNWLEETPESKTRWFRSLSPHERMEMLCAFTELALAVNPKIADLRDAQPTDRRIRVVAKP